MREWQFGEEDLDLGVMNESLRKCLYLYFCELYDTVEHSMRVGCGGLLLAHQEICMIPQPASTSSPGICCCALSFAEQKQRLRITVEDRLDR